MTSLLLCKEVIEYSSQLIGNKVLALLLRIITCHKEDLRHFCCKISLLADYHICEEVGIRRTLSRREVEPDMDLSLWGGGEDLHCGVQRVLRGAGDDVQRTRRGHHLQDAVPRLRCGPTTHQRQPAGGCGTAPCIRRRRCGR